MAGGPNRPRQPGAYSVGEDRKKGGWWKWLLLLLLLIAAIALLVALLSGDDDEDESGSAGATATQTQPAGGTPSTNPEATATGDGGTLTTEGTSLLPVPDDLSQYVGQDAEGEGVVVQKVNGQQGFWVGSSPEDRVYVEFGAKAGGTEAGAEFKPTVGQKVDLTGPVRPAPDEPGRVLRVAGADEDLVSQQGAYINADTVEAAG